MSQKPVITLDPAGVPASVNYNVPEPVSYDGVNIIELDLSQDSFLPAPLKPLTREERAAVTFDRVLDAMTRGFNNLQLFPDLGVPVGFLMYAKVVPDANGDPVPFGGCFLPQYGAEASAKLWTTAALRNLDPETVWVAISRNKNLRIVRLPSHRWDAQFVEAEATGAEPRKRLALLEYYRMSSFLGQYGAGQTINTFSLLPGERTRISIKTYKRTTHTEGRSSSVLDSLNDESAADFEDTLQAERSDRTKDARTDSWHVEAELSASFGISSASLKAGYQGSSATSREQFARNVSSALEKHASRASNRRDIKVEQTTETKTETSIEESTERELKNINVSRTLNFVFRQMNQEFITLLHLLDVRVGYTDGITTKVTPLYDLDDFLREFLVTENDPTGTPLPEDKQLRTRVRDGILKEVRVVNDYKDNPQTIIETAKLMSGDEELDSYVRFKKGLTSSYEMPGTGGKLTVDGVITSVFTNVLRTDGIVTEALLGGANGLDTYSQGLQEQALIDLDSKNDRLQKQIELQRFAHDIVREKNKDAAALLLTMFPRTKNP